MALYIRMAFYFILPSIGTISWLDWDPTVGELTVQIEGLSLALVTYGGFIATFAWSRVAKRKGGAT